ncbi:MAG: carbonic anhydrase family protein, partial [Psychrosphaera sp.]|nr:carbonic anhydrase family protein [Psychrosphaera sp.]
MLKDMNQAQQQRLAFIDFCLEYYGQIGRADLIKRFKTGLAAATRDFASYRQLAPDNLELIHQTKNYHRKDGFKPLFDHDPEAVLTGLCRGFGDGFSFGIDPSEVCVDAIRLIHPDTQIIASLMRAIKNRFALKCRYVSLSSGESERVIVPHAIINNGHAIQVNLPAGDLLQVGLDEYALNQFHFHGPSEHVLDGVHSPMEMHLVHTAAAGSLAVVGVMIREGAENAALKAAWGNLPSERGAELEPAGVEVDV